MVRSNNPLKTFVIESIMVSEITVRAHDIEQAKLFAEQKINIVNAEEKTETTIKMIGGGANAASREAD